MKLEFQRLFEDANGESQAKQDAVNGELVVGTVVSLTHDMFVDIGAKAEGVLERSELGDSPIAVSDTVEPWWYRLAAKYASPRASAVAQPRQYGIRGHTRMVFLSKAP